MDLSKYIALDEEHVLSADDVQALNLDLSARAGSDIPEGYRRRVADYLVAALNMGAIEPNIIPSIEQLLRSLQQEN